MDNTVLAKAAGLASSGIFAGSSFPIPYRYPLPKHTDLFDPKDTHGRSPTQQSRQPSTPQKPFSPNNGVNSTYVDSM